MKIRFLFKKCSRFNPISATTWLGSLNNKGAWPFNYCHVELWLPDKRFGFEQNGLYLGQCFSARPDGVSLRSACKVLAGFNWDFWEIEITDEQYNTISTFISKESGDKYDYSGLMHFILVFIAQDPERWHCSEVVGTMACLINILNLTKYCVKNYVKITPRDLGYELSKEFGKPKGLIDG